MLLAFGKNATPACFIMPAPSWRGTVASKNARFSAPP
jgi:hypothetical protein